MRLQKDLIIIEPQSQHYEIIENGFRNAGFNEKIERFTNPDQAMDFLARQSDETRILSIITELNFPDSSGLSLLESIKSNEKWRKIPIIVFTADQEPENVTKCHQAGCSFYIVKPSDQMELQNVVKKLNRFLSSIETPNI